MVNLRVSHNNLSIEVSAAAKYIIEVLPLLLYLNIPKTFQVLLIAPTDHSINT